MSCDLYVVQPYAICFISTIQMNSTKKLRDTKNQGISPKFIVVKVVVGTHSIS